MHLQSSTRDGSHVRDEWELTGDTHINYTEWARHLINHLRIKIRKEGAIEESDLLSLSLIVKKMLTL